MKLFGNTLLPGILINAVILLLVSANAHAIPAFTRAHKVECSTCHTVYPELNEYGEAFLKNSYVYFGKGGKSAKPKETKQPAAKSTTSPKAASAGSDIKGEGDAEILGKLKAGAMLATDGSFEESAAAPPQLQVEESHPAAAPTAKPEGLMLAAIPEQLPISFSGSLHGSYNGNAVNEFDFSSRAFKLNAGGNFSDKVGFFGTYIIYTENSATISNTSQTPTNMTQKNDIGELFLIWRHALGTPINLKIGRLQPKLGLWKSNNKLSATNSLAPYSYTVGQSVFRIEQPQDALEANAILANRLFLAGGVVNRKHQNAKEGYGHISYKFGGADFVANEPDIDLNKDESIFDFLTVTLGGYGYFGTNGTPNTTPGVSPTQNKFYRTGLDLDILYKLFRMKLAGVMGRDDNPELTLTNKKAVKSYVAAVEGQYSFLQNLIGSLRFEYQDDGRGYVRRYIPTLGYTPLENVKVAVEYKHEIATAYRLTATSPAQDFTNKIGTLGVTFSF